MNRLRTPVLIVGGYGYGNVGDEAILGGLLARLGRLHCTVVSRDPAATTRIHGVPCVSLAGAAAALGTHGTLLIGGGGLFGRDMGRLGRLLPMVGELAARGGRQVIISGVGVDADMPPLARWTLRRLLSVTSSISVRDEASATVLAGWGVDARVISDHSTALSPAGSAVARRILASAGVDGTRPVIGLALTDIDPELGAAVLAAAAQVVTAMPEADFCFLPMSRHPSVAAHDDRVLAHGLRSLAPRVRVLSIEDPADALAVFGRFDVVVGMRYHSLLFAEQAATPVVAIPYAEKCRHWLDERGMAPVEPSGPALLRALRGALASARQELVS